MRPSEVLHKVGFVPFMRLREGQLLYDFILALQLKRGLELGFLHGMSSAFIAGAVAELTGGSLVSVDTEAAMERRPNIHEVLSRAALEAAVSVYFEPRSIAWRLMKLLAEGERHFSFCFFHTIRSWEQAALAFCTVEPLLDVNGWVIFDEIYHSYRESSHRDAPWVTRLPEEEQISEQIRLVFELMVEKHSGFANFRRLGGFAFAQKKDPALKQEYLPHDVDIATSRALERAYLDPEYRDRLLHSSQADICALLSSREERTPELHFVESGLTHPVPAKRDGTGSFILALEQPVWHQDISRTQYELLLHRASKTRR